MYTTKEKDVARVSNDRVVAFLSYRHKEFDSAVAEKLQSLLEKFSMPKRLKKEGGARRRFHVLKDTTDFPLNADLGEGIRSALENAEYLIVICSQRLQASKYCMEEIRYFKQLQGGSTAHIIAVLIDGSPQECIPDELLTSTDPVVCADGQMERITRDVEPLCANIIAPAQQQSLRMLKREYLRVVARLAGCGYGELMVRHTRRLIRRALTIGISAAVALAGFFGYIWFQAQIIAQKNQSLVEQIHATQQQQVIRTANYARNLVESGDRVQAAAILDELYQRADPEAPQYEEFRNVADKAAFDSVLREQYSPYTEMRLSSPCTYSAFSLDNKMVATVDEEGFVSVFDVSSGTSLYTPTADVPIHGVCFTPDCLVGVSTQGAVLVWDGQTGALRHHGLVDVTLLAGYDWTTTIRRAAYHAFTDSIVFVGRAMSYENPEPSDFAIRVSGINKAADALLSDILVYDHIDISKDGEYLLWTAAQGALPDENNLLRWLAKGTLRDAGQVAIQLPEGYDVYRLADNGQLFAFGGDGSLDIFSLPDLSRMGHYDQVPGPWRVGHNDQVLSDFREARILVADDDSGDFWAWTDYDVFFYPALTLKNAVWELTEGYDYQLFRSDTTSFPLVQPIPLSSNLLVYVHSYAKSVYVCGSDGIEPVGDLQETAALGHLNASFDGSTLLTGAETGIVRLYSTKGTQVVQKSELPVLADTPLAFTKSGLAAIATDLPDYRTPEEDGVDGGDREPGREQIAIYDYSSGAKVCQLQIDLGDINAEAFLQPIRACIDEGNGRLYMILPYGIYSESRFGVWDVYSGQTIAVGDELNAALLGTNTEGISLSVSDDGNRLAVLADQTVYIFDVQEDRICASYEIRVQVSKCSLGKDHLYLLGKNIVYVMDIANGAMVRRTRMPVWEGNYLRSFQVSEQNNWVVIGGIVDWEAYDTLQWYNLRTGELIWKIGDAFGQEGLPPFIRTCIAQDGEDVLAYDTIDELLSFHALSQGEIAAMLENSAAIRKLTSQERVLSGLSIFD